MTPLRLFHLHYSGSQRRIKCVDSFWAFFFLVFTDPNSKQRAKLPKWIGQYIKEPDTNLSTDMAISSSKRFLRTMAQPFEQSSKSLWGIEEVLQRQRAENGQHTDDDADMFGDMDEEAMLREMDGQ